MSPRKTTIPQFVVGRSLLLLLIFLFDDNNWFSAITTTTTTTTTTITTAATAEEISQDPSSWFQDGCAIDPDTLTNAFGKSIPQTCIDVPYQDDGSQTSVLKRCYYTYVPESCFERAFASIPVVVDSHGLAGCPLSAASYTGWMQTAEKECFAVVWPSADHNVNNGELFNFLGGACWNLPGFLEGNDITTAPCCCFSGFLDLSGLSDEEREPDDLLFLKMAIDSLLESSFERESADSLSITIDPGRVYMAGHSNGCMASMAMAATHPDSITAVCCHSGAVITPFPEIDESLPQNEAVPIMWVHGMKDATVPFDGLTVLAYPPWGELGFISVNDTMDYLADSYGCLEEETTDLVVSNDDGAGEGFDFEIGDDETTGFGGSSNNETGTTVVGNISKRKNCRSNATIELVALYEADHYPFPIPPSLRPYFPLEPGASRIEIDTTALAWEFCSSHVKQTTPPLQEPQGGTESPKAQQEDGATTETPEEESSLATENEEPLTSSGGTLRSRKVSTLFWSVLSGVVAPALWVASAL